MPDAILIFTFSPIQPFISEARRAADLYAGSKILSRLANAAATPMQGDGCELIYPVNPNPNDTPNTLVARVPFARAEVIANDAKAKLFETWRDIANSAQEALTQYQPPPDEWWRQIWERQRDHYWEIYWVAQRVNGNYRAAFKAASDALDAVKRARAFDPAEEEGVKDNLSGRRTALRVADIPDLPEKEKTPAKICREYWRRVYSQLENPSLLRPDGKERLDTLGAVKRFCNIAGAENFASVSMVATKEYVTTATRALAFPPFRKAVEQLLSKKIYRVRSDVLWPYEGDLFFAETFTPNRLKDSYDIDKPDVGRLQEVQRALKALHDEVGKPSPYYAILRLDGDSMGRAISECESNEQHRAFSEQLARFAEQVEDIVQEHYGELIYNGGDDVLALAPLSQAMLLAQELANAFQENVKQPIDQEKSCTMSAGIAVAHHLYPLDATLNAARSAEHRAKEVDGKNAVCVRVSKRSGETFDASSSWSAMGDLFNGVVKLFEDEETGASALSSRFAYDVARSAYALPDADARLQSEFKRLLKRHRNSKHPNPPDVEKWARDLREWAEVLPDHAGELGNGGCAGTDGQTMVLPDHAGELGKWLVLARFVAQGGGE